MNVGVCNKLYLIIHRPCKKRYAFTEKGIAYDRNGNITALRRYGASASTAEDDFAFNVTDNRISSLTNTGTSGSGVTYTSYTYDANGNTTHDGRTGQDLAWNELNLIAGVSQGSGAASSTLASYTWMADGAKYASARADGTGYVYKGALVFEILKRIQGKRIMGVSSN